jgi:truncated hemoglobin YjbI
MSTSFYEQVGGRPTLEKVHKIFYDDLFEHHWLKQFFKDINQKHIEDQQTDFMSMVFGGPKCYMGKVPKIAHKHIFVDQEIIDLRQDYLRKAILEAGLSEEIANTWLAKDAQFAAVVLKDSPNQCEPRYPGDEVLVIPKP